MNAIEQELVNVAAIAADTVGTLAAAKNPAYASLIQLGQSFVDSVNSQVNPTGAATATQLSGTIAAAIQPATTAVKTVASSASTAPQKAAAITGLLGLLQSVGAEFAALFHPKTS
jgi:broad specificity polyphosphatase/5'/3'-nucleotidase SurE